jgi:hypothetical protein
MARVRASVLVAMLVGVGCGLFPSLDGLSGEHPDGSAVDASDASFVSDAVTADAADAGDGGRWCDSLVPAPMFCDDFDDQGFFSRWTNTLTANGGSVSRDTSAFQSAPNSLLSLAPASSSSVQAAVYLEATTTKSKVHAAYDMRIDARDPAVGYAEVNYIHFYTPGLEFAFYMRVYNNTGPSTITSEAYLADGGIPSHDVPLAGSSTFAAWTRVDVDVDLASSTHMLTVKLDNQIAGQQVLESNLYAPGPVRVTVGTGYTGHPTTSAWTIRYDNATIDWQ